MVLLLFFFPANGDDSDGNDCINGINSDLCSVIYVRNNFIAVKFITVFR